MPAAVQKQHISSAGRIRWIVSGVLLTLTAAIYLLARYAPGIMFPWYQTISRRALNLWAELTDLLPFSLFEWGVVGLSWLAIGWLIRVIATGRGLGKLLSTAVLIGSIILFLFVSLWGADQFAPTFLSSTPYGQTNYSIEEAAAAAEYYLDMANRYAAESERNSNGITDFGDFRGIADGVESGYRYLESEYGARFAIGDAEPKGMVFSNVMSICGLTGIYTAYTGEVNVNVDTPDPSLPYVISHECAHRTTVTQEQDANFVAFLACIHSADVRYRYSGYYSAFVYVYNAIAKVDRELQGKLWSGMNDQLRADVLAANEHYARYATRVQRTAQKVNDSYLKSFNQSNGVDNYGAVAGPLIGYYLMEIA